MWTFNPETEKMHKIAIEYVPGLLKIFDEILVNAGDNTKEDELCDSIKVNINKEENEISVCQQGPSFKKKKKTKLFFNPTNIIDSNFSRTQKIKNNTQHNNKTTQTKKII